MQLIEIKLFNDWFIRGLSNFEGETKPQGAELRESKFKGKKQLTQNVCVY